MDLVVLASGGVDSSLVAVMASRRGLRVLPLYIDYGQIAKEKELDACRRSMKKHNLPEPDVIDVSGYGRAFPSGLTDRSKNIFEDAFLPGRNALLLVMAAAYGYHHGATSVGIGLLNEDDCIFPDQTDNFLETMESSLSASLGVSIDVIAPLRYMNKQQVVELAREYAIEDTWSCHSDGEHSCGFCVACREFKQT